MLASAPPEAAVAVVVAVVVVVVEAVEVVAVATMRVISLVMTKGGVAIERKAGGTSGKTSRRVGSGVGVRACSRL
jgi:hypothetical protein